MPSTCAKCNYCDHNVFISPCSTCSDIATPPTLMCGVRIGTIHVVYHREFLVVLFLVPVFCDIFSSVYIIIETVKKPKLQSSPCIGDNGLTATLMWNHTDQGPCFTNLTFSYNITWYPVAQRGEWQSALTIPGATAYIITNLMNGTDYQVELFGFTSSDPVVYSEVAMVNFTADLEGVYILCSMYITVRPYSIHVCTEITDYHFVILVNYLNALPTNRCIPSNSTYSTFKLHRYVCRVHAHACIHVLCAQLHVRVCCVCAH